MANPSTNLGRPAEPVVMEWARRKWAGQQWPADAVGYLHRNMLRVFSSGKMLLECAVPAHAMVVPDADVWLGAMQMSERPELAGLPLFDKPEDPDAQGSLL